ncbi:4878_t:CDS:2, partial [Racocetra persica]
KEKKNNKEINERISYTKEAKLTNISKNSDKERTTNNESEIFKSYQRPMGVYDVSEKFTEADEVKRKENKAFGYSQKLAEKSIRRVMLLEQLILEVQESRFVDGFKNKAKTLRKRENLNGAKELVANNDK